MPPSCQRRKQRMRKTATESQVYQTNLNKFSIIFFDIFFDFFYGFFLREGSVPLILLIFRTLVLFFGNFSTSFYPTHVRLTSVGTSVSHKLVGSNFLFLFSEEYTYV